MRLQRPVPNLSKRTFQSPVPGRTASKAPMDALYFGVSSDRQTTENQFDELIVEAA